MDKQFLAAAWLAALSATAVAQDMARVISSTGVTQQVGVPRQACATYATPGVPPQCSTQMVFESRTVAYNVVYEHAGKRYSVQLPQDPGPTMRVAAGAVELPAPVAPVAVAPSAAPPRPAPAARITSVVPIGNDSGSASNAAAPSSVVIDDPGLPGEARMAAQPYPPPVQVTYAYSGYPGYPGYVARYAPGYGSYYGSPYFWGPVVTLGLVSGYYGARHHYRGHWHGRRR